MNRTKRLLILASASLLLAGAGDAPAQGSGNSTDQTGGIPPLADAVLEALDGVRRVDAITMEDLAKRPEFNSQPSSQLQAALDYQTDTGRIRRIGHGTPGDPFKYYDQETVTG